MLPVQDMMLFVSVVSEGGFSAAARKNRLTTAAISKRISHFEKKLGMRLLHRTTRKMILTEAGRKLYENCKSIYAEIEDAYSSISDIQGSMKGKIRILAPINFSKIVLAPILAKFLQTYPGIEVIIDTTNIAKAGSLDIYDIVIKAQVDENERIYRKKLTPCSAVVCCAPSYIKRYGAPQTPEELAQHNCLDYAQRQPPGIWGFSKNKKTFEIPVSGNLLSNNGTVVKNAALQGLGIVHLPAFMVQEEIAQGSLVALLKNFEPKGFDLYLYYLIARTYLPKKITACIDVIQEEMKRLKL